MTGAQTVHLIEQFAAQAPFAVWVTDSRGISIFANRKLHEIFAIPEHPSGALGFNLFEDPAVAALGIAALARKARSGEVVEAVIDIPRPDGVGTPVRGARKDPLTIRTICYALRSSTQAIEHYVILITDVTETVRNREELKARLRDLAIYDKSREARLARQEELEAEVARLEKDLRARGVEPAG
jgi:PAS domain-containing protein